MYDPASVAYAGLKLLPTATELLDCRATRAELGRPCLTPGVLASKIQHEPAVWATVVYCGEMLRFTRWSDCFTS